jgi:hypothetical protein
VQWRFFNNHLFRVCSILLLSLQRILLTMAGSQDWLPYSLITVIVWSDRYVCPIDLVIALLPTLSWTVTRRDIERGTKWMAKMD